MEARAQNVGGGSIVRGEKEGFINKDGFAAERLNRVYYYYYFVWRPCFVLLNIVTRAMNK